MPGSNAQRGDCGHSGYGRCGSNFFFVRDGRARRNWNRTRSLTVPQREEGMTAYQMLLSESQERMLIVAHAGREREVADIFRKWDLEAVVIGQVHDDGRMRVTH